MTERNNASLDGVVVGDGIFGDLFEKRGLLKGGGVLDTQLLKVQSTKYFVSDLHEHVAMSLRT
jgi:hypothetical protein